MAHERGARPTQGGPPIVHGSSDGRRGDDFPILCETCLGPNPYVRMIKLPYGDKLCQLTNAPFQAFRWKVKGGRTKETIITPDVASQRNICQACLNDLQFGVPVGVRDSMLQRGDAEALAVPHSYVNAQYFYKNQAESQQAGAGGSGSAQQAIQDAPASRQLLNLSRSLQTAERRQVTAWRNLPKLCTFWLSGICTRVVRKACPFRPCNGQHVFPELASTHPELNKALIQTCNTEGPAKAMKLMDDETRNALREALKGNKSDKIKQRIHGEDDLSKKYLTRIKTMNMELAAPEDTSITTLWVGGMQDDMTEADLRDVFYAYGEIRSIFIVRAQKCAFVEFSDRAGAEHAVKQLFRALMVKGQSLALNWSRPKALAGEGARTGDEEQAQGPLQMLPPPGMDASQIQQYALPNMPLPTAELGYRPPPPSAPPPNPSRQQVHPRDPSSDANVPASKRPHTEPPQNAPTRQPPQVHSAAPVRNKPPPKPGKPMYPSMNTQRLGSHV